MAEKSEERNIGYLKKQSNIKLRKPKEQMEISDIREKMAMKSEERNIEYNRNRKRSNIKSQLDKQMNQKMIELSDLILI